MGKSGQKVGGLGDYDGDIGVPEMRAPTPFMMVMAMVSSPNELSM